METTSKKIEISVEDRYYLVGESGWIFSSNNYDNVVDFRNKMEDSRRFSKKTIDGLLIVDILSLGKKY